MAHKFIHNPEFKNRLLASLRSGDVASISKILTRYIGANHLLGGQSALHLCIQNGFNPKAFQALLDLGCDPALPNKDGQSPLMLALLNARSPDPALARERRSMALRLLACSKLEARDKNGANALFYLNAIADPEMARAFPRRAFAKPNAQGLTALSSYIRCNVLALSKPPYLPGQNPYLETLLELSPLQSAEMSQTPLMVCMSVNILPLFERLLPLCDTAFPNKGGLSEIAFAKSLSDARWATLIEARRLALLEQSEIGTALPAGPSPQPGAKPRI